MKKIKKWKCCKCGKEYCFITFAINHRKSRGKENHVKFKKINSELKI